MPPQRAGGNAGLTAGPSGVVMAKDVARAAETHLLYDNADTGTVVSVVIASLLAYALRTAAPRGVILAWLAYMLLVAAARSLLVRRYRRVSPDEQAHPGWNQAFVVGVALAALGWGASAFVLNPTSQPANERLLVFAVGGMMLGGASLLAARPEAFLTFLLPVGLLTAAHLASLGDPDHVLMAGLAVLFTLATAVTTWRFHQAIASVFALRAANRDLIDSLRRAKDDADAVNRQLELRVQERTAMLTDADRRKDEFLATLAHELRNPLAPIRFALDVLARGASSPGAVRAREVIDRQVNQLVRLVDDLLDVSRITANKIQLRRDTLDIAVLMANAAESVAPLAAAAGQTLHVESPTTRLCVNADGARLIQVFTNVLQNAVKFTPRGGDIWFTADQQVGQVVVQVRDTGIGIAADVLPRVFEMFHQAAPILDRTTGGLGIGLTLARRLVEMHGGVIGVRSAGPNEGTVVEILLPLTTESTPTVSSVATPPIAQGKLRVLIVEDNRDAAEMLEVALSHLGHETALAHDGATAITVAKAFVPDVIFLDIGLPVMNGYAVARRLREIPALSHVHIAALTGWGQDEDRRKAREAGCDYHLTKPLAPEALDALLATIVCRASAPGAEPVTPRTRRTDAGGYAIDAATAGGQEGRAMDGPTET